MDSPLYIAIQGAAKCAKLAACDDAGRIIAVTTVGPLAIKINFDFKESLRAASMALAKDLGIGSLEQLSRRTRRICIAMSGVFQEGDHYAVRQQLESIAFVGESDPLICEDVWAVLAAEGCNSGAVIMVSTGSNVFVRESSSDFIAVGGWGSELADLGSGYYLGKRALTALFDFNDSRRSISRRFVEQVIAFLHLTTVTQIVPWYHELAKTSLWRCKVADLAIVVVRLAEQYGDITAKQILNQGCVEIEKSIRAAVRAADKKGFFSRHSVFPFFLAGGVAQHSKFYQRRIKKAIAREKSRRALKHIDFKIAQSTMHPVVGALAFALANQTEISFNSYKALVKSAKRFPGLCRMT